MKSLININVKHLLILLVLNFLISTTIYSQKTINIPFVHDYKTADSLRQIYEDKHLFDTALVYANQALTLVEKQYGKNDTLYADMLLGATSIFYHSGRNKKAIEYLLKEKQIREIKQGKQHPAYGSAIGNLSVLYKNNGQYDKALPLSLEALENTEKKFGKEHSKYGVRLNNLASLYKAMGQYKKALPLNIEALKITEKTLGKEHYEYGIRVNNLASLYKTMRQYKKALPLSLEALESTEKSLGKEHPKYCIRLNNLASLYKAMGQYNKALPLSIEALDITKQVLGKEHFQYGVRLNNLASLYEAMEQYQKAIPLYIEALENFNKLLGKEHPNYVSPLNNLAGLYKDINKYDKALPLYIEGIENINKDIIKNFSFLSEKEKELYFNKRSYNFRIFNSFALQSKEQFPSITTKVYDNTVRNKGILLKSSTAMRMAILNSKDTILINKYDKWITLNKEIVKLYSTPLIKRKKYPKKLEEQANVLERDLVSQSQEFFAYRNILKIQWQNVQKALKPNEIAIEFVHFHLYGKNKWKDTIMYCALIVTPQNKYPEMLPLFEEKQLEKIIGKYGGNNYSYINSIYGKNKEGNTKLYNLIWEPMEESLKGAKKIYISPSGLLHKISFPAIAKDKNVYLCDNYDIEIKSTTSKVVDKNYNDFAKLQINTVTLFGGITYNTDSTKQEIWSYLEGTKTETQKIDKILKKGKVNVNYFSNISATEGEFKLMATNSNILHIATHGFFYPDPNEVEKEETEKIDKSEVVFRGGSRGFGVESFVENRNPLMRSGLVFAGANDVWSKQNKGNTDDGVLTAQEVANIDMRETDLVVMSACETGLGDIKGSEGVYGLQRAFKMAGVKYEIMSLWQVPDKETEEFMTIFYKKLIKQKDIKQAFAQTQKEMRKKYDPYFWAAFVLIE